MAHRGETVTQAFLDLILLQMITKKMVSYGVVVRLLCGLALVHRGVQLVTMTVRSKEKTCWWTPNDVQR